MMAKVWKETRFCGPKGGRRAMVALLRPGLPGSPQCDQGFHLEYAVSHNLIRSNPEE